MRKTFLPGICLALTLLGTGCQDTVNTVKNENQVMTPQIIKDKRFITDSALNDRLGLTSLAVARTEDGFLRVQLEAVNLRTGIFSQLWSGLTEENPYDIRYKFIWFGKDGMAVENTLISDWKTVTVIPGEVIYLQSIAPDRNCNDFQISLKEAN